MHDDQTLLADLASDPTLRSVDRRLFTLSMDPQELHRLARDRRLVTPELHVPNDFYGHAALLKQYAGLPASRPLKVIIEHAPIALGLIWAADLASALPVFLCCSPKRAREYERRSGFSKKAEAIGPLTAYVGRTPPDAPRQGRDRRLLVFPAHSTHRVRASYEAERFAELLIAYQRDWDSIEVCVYWRDVLYGLDRVFARYGLSTVTAGHMFDREFLPRLLSLIRGASAVVTNEFGSHLLYAVLQDRPVWFVDQNVDYSAEQEVLDEDFGNADEWLRIRKHIQQLFSEPCSAPTARQRRLVEDLTGMESVRSPSALRAIFEEAEDRYRRERGLIERAARRAKRWIAYHRDRALAGTHSPSATDLLRRSLDSSCV